MIARESKNEAILSCVELFCHFGGQLEGFLLSLLATFCLTPPVAEKLVRWTRINIGIKVMMETVNMKNHMMDNRVILNFLPFSPCWRNFRSEGEVVLQKRKRVQETRQHSFSRQMTKQRTSFSSGSGLRDSFIHLDNA
jgi:hypothetical protein